MLRRIETQASHPVVLLPVDVSALGGVPVSYLQFELNVTVNYAISLFDAAAVPVFM